MIADFDYKSLGVLFFLLIPLLLLTFYQLHRLNKEKTLLGSSMISFDKGLLFFKRLAPLVIFSLLVFALMGPKGNPHYSDEEIKNEKTLVPAKGNIVLILDTSASMLAQDTPTKESRFSAAKDLADEIMKSPMSPYFTFYALGSDYVKLVPRTLDKVFTRLIVNQTQINDGGAGTDFLSGVKALNLDLKELPEPVALIYLTDGEDSEFDGMTDVQKKERIDAIYKALFKDMAHPFPIYTVGFGSFEGAVIPGLLYQGKPVTSKLGLTLLKDLSLRSQGKAWIFNQSGRSQVYEELMQDLQSQRSQLSQETLKDAKQSLIWDHYYQWPLFLALLLGLVWYYLPASFNPRKALLVPYLAASLLNQEIQTLLEAGSTEEVENLIQQNLDQSNVPLSSWEKEALQFNLAILELNKGDYKEGREKLDSLSISKDSSPYVLEKLDQATAYAFLGEIRDNKKDDLKVLQLFSALYSLRDAESELCLMQQEKGYKDCTPGFITGELKKWGKESVEKHYEKFSEEDPLSMLSFGLEWQARTELTIQNADYYNPFLKDLESSYPPNFKDALNNFVQKDFTESIQFFKKENDDLRKKVSLVPVIERVRKALSRSLWTIYDLKAIGDERVDPALKKLERGQYLYSRLMLLILYQDLKREQFVNTTPIEVLKNSIDELNYLILLQVFAKEIKDFKEEALISKAQENSLKALSFFLPQSAKFRQEQFLLKGCETAPWAQVIPLYESGFLDQKKSQEWLIQKKNVPALKSQITSLKSLEEALKLLESPPSSAQSPQSKEALSDTLRQFQDLEISDRELNKVSPTSPEVDKPW